MYFLFIIYLIFVDSIVANMTTKPILKLVAFDLDGTIWNPEMYELWGGGSPFKLVSNQEAIDKSGVSVKLLGVSGDAFDYLKENDIKIAIVSCTDEPLWAKQLLEMFKTPKNRVLQKQIDSNQIFKAYPKTIHFEKIKNQFSDINFSEMLFFDNEMSNIQSVSKISVKSIYCPDGVTDEIFKKGLSLFQINSKVELEA